MQRSPLELYCCIPWIYLGFLFVGFMGIGWLMAAFDVPWVVWLITIFLIFYLCKTGVDGIALSSAWVVSFVSVGAVLKSWPTVWNSEIPYKAANLWATGLLGIWIGAIALVWLLANASSAMQPIVTRLGMQGQKTQHLLLALTWSALGLGWMIYSQLHSSLSPNAPR